MKQCSVKEKVRLLKELMNYFVNFSKIYDILV